MSASLHEKAPSARIRHRPRLTFPTARRRVAPVHERRPRLLLVSPDFPPARGGIQVLVHRLAAGMDGFDTRVVTLDSPGAGLFDASSAVPARRVHAGGRWQAARKAALNGAILVEALRVRPDVVLSGHVLTSPAAALVRHLLGAPVVQYFYANEIAGKPRLASFAARRAQRTIVISAYTAALLAARGAPRERVRLVAPGVDLPAEAPPPIDRTGAGGRPPGRPMILTIARLRERYKGHDVLIEALAAIRTRVPDVEWVVIGDGPLRGELEELARARGVADAVRWLGAVTDAQREEWLSRADVFAMPSRLPYDGGAGEGFGIVYLEAAAHGRPVVAGNVAGATDAVADGESGLLVDPTDPDAVAGAIVELLCDRELARRLGAAGARRARSFAWPVICRRVEAVLSEALAGTRSGG